MAWPDQWRNMRGRGKGAWCPLAAFTGLAKQSSRAGEDMKEGERKKRRREKKKEWHTKVTTVRLGANGSDYTVRLVPLTMS